MTTHSQDSGFGSSTTIASVSSANPRPNQLPLQDKAEPGFPKGFNPARLINPARTFEFGQAHSRQARSDQSPRYNSRDARDNRSSSLPRSFDRQEGKDRNRSQDRVPREHSQSRDRSFLPERKQRPYQKSGPGYYHPNHPARTRPFSTSRRVSFVDSHQIHEDNSDIENKENIDPRYRNRPPTSRVSVECYYCHKKGHIFSECRSRKSDLRIYHGQRRRQPN